MATPTSLLSQYPPEEPQMRWGALGSFSIHVLVVLFVLLLAFLTHVKSLEELMRESGSIATNGPAPEDPMEVTLEQLAPPPPPTDHVEFAKQIELPKPELPKPPPAKVQPVKKPKPHFTAPRATGSGATNTVSKLVVGSGNFPAPQYPYYARLHHESGIVTVNIQFDSAGRAEGVEIVRSCGYDDLDDNAREWIRDKWQDASFAGQSATVPVQYTLN